MMVMVKEEWLMNLKFYFLLLYYSTKHLFLHFVNTIIHPDHYKDSKIIAVPPKCLTFEENGSHQYAKLSSSKFHYVEKGNKSNRLILLIHGFPEFWYSWRFQLRSLSKHYWVIALDLKGFGDSDKPREKFHYDIPVLVQEIRDFLTAIGRSKCTIVTHGLGGLVAWYYLNEFPETVENFVSISSPHPLSFLQQLTQNRVQNQSWYFFCSLPHFPEKEVLKNNIEKFDKIYAPLLSRRRGNMTQQDLEAFKYTFSRKEDWIGPINYIRTLLFRQSKYNKKLSKSTVPTLFIIGNSDPHTSLESICKSSEYSENFSIKIIDGGGGFLAQEMPHYVNSLILEFMKKPLLEDTGQDHNGSIFKKVIGAGKNVVNSTVNYGNQVWSSSKDAVSRGYTVYPKKLGS